MKNNLNYINQVLDVSCSTFKEKINPHVKCVYIVSLPCRCFLVSDEVQVQYIMLKSRAPVNKKRLKHNFLSIVVYVQSFNALSHQLIHLTTSPIFSVDLVWDFVFVYISICSIILFLLGLIWPFQLITAFTWN